MDPLAAQVLENETARYMKAHRAGMARAHRRNDHAKIGKTRYTLPWNRLDTPLTLHLCDSVKQKLYGEEGS